MRWVLPVWALPAAWGVVVPVFLPSSLWLDRADGRAWLVWCVRVEPCGAAQMVWRMGYPFNACVFGWYFVLVVGQLPCEADMGFALKSCYMDTRAAVPCETFTV